MYPAAISLLLRRWSTCYSTEPFTRREAVMQENYLFSWICSSIHVFTRCLVISIMSTLQFLVHVLMLIKNPGGKQGVFSHEIGETHKTMQSLSDVDPFLMLEVFALDKNRTNIKLHKVFIF